MAAADPPKASTANGIAAITMKSPANEAASAPTRRRTAPDFIARQVSAEIFMTDAASSVRM
jgi:hypothetical protein